MSKKNDDFFVEKKPWSEVKDQLLGCYLKPYVAKILCTRKPLVYVDCFAGKGKFDDGKQGSPLIALEIMQECLASSTIKGVQINSAFIDLNYANDLRTNLKDYPNISIISGAYEDKIDELLQNKANCNVFLYIDPYGIKALDCSKFDEFANGRFHSIELLINMNSFGFIREGCRVMGKQFKMDDDDTFFDELVEYEPTRLDASDKSVVALNHIAGGDYWKSIIEQYINGKINGYEAEEYLSEQYCQRLGQTFKYVLNMPIRIRPGQHTKYRMIHATNHPDGCVLMADNISKRWELMKQIQTGGQMSFFQETVDNQIINEAEIKTNVMKHFSHYDSWTALNETLAGFFVNYGVVCRSGEIAKVLKALEKDGRLEVRRNPRLTEKGKPSTFMAEGHGKTVSVKWVK